MQAGARSIKNAKQMRIWLRIAQVMAIGYSAMSRTFAYIGIIPLKIFISEIMLGWFLVRRWRAVEWFFSRAKVGKQAKQLRSAMIPFLIYGFVSLAIGYARQPENAFVAFQNLAYNYYTLYLVIGVWIA